MCACMLSLRCHSSARDSAPKESQHSMHTAAAAAEAAQIREKKPPDSSARSLSARLSVIRAQIHTAGQHTLVHTACKRSTREGRVGSSCPTNQCRAQHEIMILSRQHRKSKQPPPNATDTESSVCWYCGSADSAQWKISADNFHGSVLRDRAK